jgi:hypothetical protein
MITPTTAPTDYSPSPVGASGQITPALQNLVGWSYDVAMAAASSSPTNGTLYVTRLQIDRVATVSNLLLVCTGAAVTPTAGQNAVGLFNSAGVLIASASLDAALGASGPVVAPCTPVGVTPGIYYVGFFTNAVTPATMARGSGVSGSATGTNIGASGASLRFATGPTGLTSIPGSITPAALVTSGSVSFWAGVS